MEYKYNITSPESIEAFGKRLLNKTLSAVPGQLDIPKDDLQRRVGARERASFGNIVERYYYGIIPDNNSGEPDFPEAGVELKTTPIKKIKGNRYSAKERLVLGMIDYIEESKKEFKTSSFMRKNKKLMLVSYLHEQGIPVGDLAVKIARLVDFDKLPLEDRKIIQEDWQKIHKKICDEKAHELSEGDTLYLGACTKAADSSMYRQQLGKKPAKPRAYSFKSGYMTELVRRELEGAPSEDEKALKAVEVQQPVAFEEIIKNKFKPYIGLTLKEIHSLVGKGLNKTSKDYNAALARRMMGVKGARVSEFDAAEVSMKTVQLRSDGMPKEHMSFPAFKYKELVEEVWDCDEETGCAASEFQSQIEKRFFFVVYQCDGDCKEGDQKRLKGVMFWSMPFADREEARNVWKETIKQIKAGKGDELPGATDSRVAHVRPHARDSSDTDETPDGQHLVKKCFWLNQGYLKEVIIL